MNLIQLQQSGRIIERLLKEADRMDQHYMAVSAPELKLFQDTINQLWVELNQERTKNKPPTLGEGIITTIEVLKDSVKVTTPGFGWNTVWRHNMPELWQWHEAIAQCVANHHASAMGQLLPCPEPVASTKEEMDPEMALQLQDDEDQAEPPYDSGDESLQGAWEPSKRAPECCAHGIGDYGRHCPTLEEVAYNQQLDVPEAQPPQEEPNEPLRWSWMMRWCRERGLPPARQDCWNKAKDAWAQEHQKPITGQ